MSKQNEHEKRKARALRIMRQLAKQFGYRVGGRGGTQVEEFMNHIESGKIIITQAHVVKMQRRRDMKQVTTKYGTATYYKDEEGWWIDTSNGAGFLLEHGAETEADCIKSAKTNLEEERRNNPGRKGNEILS